MNVISRTRDGQSRAVLESEFFIPATVSLRTGISPFKLRNLLPFVRQVHAEGRLMLHLGDALLADGRGLR
jgi:hypothetical protein